MTNVESNVRNLPIFKNFSEGEISKNVDSFRKGFINEKGMFNFFKLAVLLGCLYGGWLLLGALPTILAPVFEAIGQFLHVVTTVLLIVFAVIFAPVAIKAIRMFTRMIHKTLIKYDPFAELYRQKALMLENQKTFRISKATIANLKQDCDIEADKNEKDAKKFQDRILQLDKKAKALKTSMDDLVKEGGMAAKGSDEYINANDELFKTVSESQRIAYQLAQAKDFVQKYGARSAVMKKFGQKLNMVETSMDIKILDFDATIEILKKDFDFAQKSRTATDAAKSAMLFTKSWELEYALEVVTSTISSDIAITAGNIKDIDSLTKNYALDSDELYTNLGTLADNIRIGNDVIPQAKAYNNPEYQLTSTDKLNSSGFGEIF
jgi:hypothetical protein